MRAPLRVRASTITMASASAAMIRLRASYRTFECPERCFPLVTTLIEQTLVPQYAVWLHS